MAEIIKYKRGNAQGPGGSKVNPIIEWNDGTAKSADLHNFFRENTTWTTLAGDQGFTVDKAVNANLVKALDAHPMVFRAGGETPAGSSGIGFD